MILLSLRHWHRQRNARPTPPVQITFCTYHACCRGKTCGVKALQLNPVVILVQLHCLRYSVCSCLLLDPMRFRFRAPPSKGRSQSQDVENRGKRQKYERIVIIATSSVAEHWCHQISCCSCPSPCPEIREEASIDTTDFFFFCDNKT